MSLVRMVQVDPLVQVDPTLAYAKKYAHRSSCVLNTEQSRGFKCGICLGRRRHTHRSARPRARSEHRRSHALPGRPRRRWWNPPGRPKGEYDWGAPDIQEGEKKDLKHRLIVQGVEKLIEEHGLDTKGNKEDLVKRLIEVGAKPLIMRATSSLDSPLVTVLRPGQLIRVVEEMELGDGKLRTVVKAVGRGLEWTGFLLDLWMRKKALRWIQRSWRGA